MKRSAPSLHFLAAAAITDAATATAVMSSRHTFRGGRRNFSDRPSREQSEHDIVTGDSHLQSVREDNRTPRPSPNFRPFRPRAQAPSFHPNQQTYGPSRQDILHNQQFYGAVQPPTGLYHNQQFNRAVLPLAHGPQYYPNQQFSRPNFYDNQQFNRPSFYGNQQFNRPNFYENQQFRPRPSPPKALNFRNWEYARPGPPPHCERFTVLSYNILADSLAINHQRKLYFHIPPHILDWEWRKRSILSELGWWSADILCFQEVDRYHEFEAELKLRGYNGIWKRRTGDPADGCAIFWHASRFKLVHEELIEFKKFGLRDNVAQICVFESLGQQNKNDAPVPSASACHSNKVVICNTHVLFNPRRGEIKLGQVRVLLDKADGVSKLWDNAPVVICGDFNSTPKSPLYNYISEQRLDLSEVPRDKVSGQESAIINTVKRSSLNSSARYQCAQKSGESSILAGEREETKESKMSLDLQKHESLEKGSGSGSSVDTLSQRHNSEVYEPNTCCVVISCPESTNDSPRETHVEGTSHEVDSLESCQEDGYDKDTREIARSSISDSSSVHEVPPMENSENVVSIGKGSCTKMSHEPDTCFEVLLDEKMDNLSLNEVSKGIKEEFLGQDRETFLSQLRGEASSFPSDSGQFQTNASLEELNDSLSLVSEVVDWENSTYDPSAWTPMDIETATGNADCTIMEHNLKLKSAYREVEFQGFSATRDTSGEPEVTSYHRLFMGTVDYIWRSKGLQTVRVLAPIPKNAMQFVRGFPTKKWGSDHIALVSELAFTNDVFAQDTSFQKK